MKIFAITDNKAWFKKISSWRKNLHHQLKIFCSPKGEPLFRDELDSGLIFSIDLKNDCVELIKDYDIGFSLHCKQIFPEKLVKEVRCYNVHPGLNPFNRGWFPQVFSILNGLPVGATIHEMDENIDNGRIITQKEVKILESDTSKDVYDKVVSAEFSLFDQVIDSILSHSYSSFPPKVEGNYNSISDFKSLCEIDLNRKLTFKEAIDYLRALTFDGYDNAYFYDKNGNKNYVSINIKPEFR